MGTWALIRNGIVENLVAADADFVAKIAADWDFILDVSADVPQPGIGWGYDGANFTPPAAIPETPEQAADREARERLEAIKRDGNIPIQGQALQDLLADIIEVLF
jgi:hypothetical protein